ncbi:MAG: transposase [Gammaproteobacteria bacterium]|nr:transposase [Gammaproteobacteria bacterium]
MELFGRSTCGGKRDGCVDRLLNEDAGGILADQRNEVLRHRMQTTAGKQLHRTRQQTVEPVFGIIKSVLGFRRFLLRGPARVSIEWTLVGLAYNLTRQRRRRLSHSHSPLARSLPARR